MVLARRRGGLFHVDAAQGPGRVPVTTSTIGADLLTLSAHKIGGPPGVGALILREGAPFAAQILGGGQERGRRAGTENLAGIACFGAAAEVAVREPGCSVALRDRFEAGLMSLAPDAVVFGAEAPRLANTSNFALPGLTAETALMALDLDGVMMSSGAAKNI